MIIVPRTILLCCVYYFFLFIFRWENSSAQARKTGFHRHSTHNGQGTTGKTINPRPIPTSWVAL
jgi:hypothetical protein